MQAINVDIWLTVTLGTIALLVIAIGFIVVVVASKQKELISKKQQIKELALSERKYKNLFEYSPAGMLRMESSDWDVVDANQALMDMLETQSKEEIKTIFSTLPASDREFFDSKLSVDGSVKDFETSLLRKDKSSLWVSISAATVRQENHVEAAIIDITSRKEAEERIREQAKLLDQAHDGIFVTGLDNDIRYWNKGAERIYQYKSTEVVGKNVANYIYGSDQLDGQQKAIELTNKNLEWAGELYQKKKNGTVVITNCRWTLVRNSNNEPTGILQVCTDITERKRLEARFLKAQRVESIGIFASGIAHDINNALSPILVGANVLKRKVHDQQSRRLLNAIESSAKDGTEMVRQVLSFVKGVEGKHVILNPRKILKDVISQLDQILPESVSIQTRVAEKISSIMGDATQLHQVLMNLCLNARDAMLNGGELTLEVENKWIDKNNADEFVGEVQGEYVVFSIKDTGIGIPSSEIHKIFDPFYTTKELGKGTGLGLSISHGIVKGHKGFISVESSEGKGSTFKMFIPSMSNEEKVGLLEKDSQDIHRKIIFIPASEDEYSETLYDGLEEKGYETHLASGKAQVMKMIFKFRDENVLALFDGYSSDETAQLIKEINKIGLNIPCITLINGNQINQIQRNEMSQLSTILQQPITIELLDETIQRVFSGK